MSNEQFDNEEEETTECPLCLEELDVTELNFQPCKCGYQVCLWCFHNINEKLNGKCPACRANYDENGYQFTAPDQSTLQHALQETNRKKKSKDDREGGGAKKVQPPFRKVDVSNLRKEDVRILQRKLCYVVGLPASVAREDILKKKEYFGKFGRIVKIAINRKHLPAGGYSYSAYVTFKEAPAAMAAIKATNATVVDGRVLKATFGTTKYCSYFMRGVPCTNPGCLYLHEAAKPDDCFSKDDLSLANAASLATPDPTTAFMLPRHFPAGQGHASQPAIGTSLQPLGQQGLGQLGQPLLHIGVPGLGARLGQMPDAHAQPDPKALSAPIAPWASAALTRTASTPAEDTTSLQQSSSSSSATTTTTTTATTSSSSSSSAAPSSAVTQPTTIPAQHSHGPPPNLHQNKPPIPSDFNATTSQAFPKGADAASLSRSGVKPPPGLGGAGVGVGRGAMGGVRPPPGFNMFGARGPGLSAPPPSNPPRMPADDDSLQHVLLNSRWDFRKFVLGLPAGQPLTFQLGFAALPNLAPRPPTCSRYSFAQSGQGHTSTGPQSLSVFPSNPTGSW